MSGLMAFATGFLNGSVEVQRERAAAEISSNEARALRQKQAMDRLATADAKTMPRSVYEALAADAGVTLFETGNMFNDAANNQTIGGVTFKGYEHSGTGTPYNRAINDVSHLNTLLMDETFRNEVTEAIKGEGREGWFKYLTRLENSASFGYDKVAAGEQGINSATPSQYKFDMAAYQHIDYLAGLFGGEVETATNASLTSQLPPVNIAGQKIPKDAAPAMFEVRAVDGGTMNVGMYLKPENLKIAEQIAAKSNMSTAEFIGSFNQLRNLPTANEIEEGVYKYEDGTDFSDEDIARHQYSMLHDVIDFHKAGFGEIDVFAASKQKRQEFRDFVLQKFGSRNSEGELYGGIDRYRAASALAYLQETPGFFNVIPDNSIFGGRAKQPSRATINGREYMKSPEGLGLTDAAITKREDGGKFARETVGLLDTLYNLEIDELKETQGMARWVEKTAGGLLVQVSQVTGVIGKIFSSGDQEAKDYDSLPDVFQGNYKADKDGGATSSESLMDVVKRVSQDPKSGINANLANITEADALRLTLAAKMARAIDPSGRLSNQDFEIQLRRLGGAMIGNAETVKRNLEVIAREFEREVQRNIVFERMAKRSSKITAQQARMLSADAELELMLESDISILGSSQQTTNAGGGDTPPLDATSNYVDLTGLKTKLVEDREYIGPEGKAFPVIMYRPEGGGLAYVANMNGNFFPIGRDSLQPISPTK